MPTVGKALPDYTETEIGDMLRQSSEHVVYYYADLIAELDRRAANRQARQSRILSFVSLAIAVAAIIVSALK
jgi:hypothetical protein